MHVDLSINIHQERVVVVVRLKQVIERRCHAPDVAVQLQPLIVFELTDVVAVSAKDKHDLAQEILIAVDHNRPCSSLLDDRPQIRSERGHDTRLESETRIAAPL